MSDKIMHGWVHVAAMILGIGLPAGLTMGTLRTGANYEVVATPRQVVDGIEKALAMHDTSRLNQLVAPDVITHRSVSQAGDATFLQAAMAAADRTRALSARRVSANASLVMIESTAENGRSVAPVVQIYRVHGGKIVEYWSADPLR